MISQTTTLASIDFAIKLCKMFTETNLNFNKTRTHCTRLRWLRRLRSFPLFQIEMYSLQMYHNRLKFYVCGLFPLDYTLLHTVWAAFVPGTFLLTVAFYRLSPALRRTSSSWYSSTAPTATSLTSMLLPHRSIWRRRYNGKTSPRNSISPLRRDPRGEEAHVVLCVLKIRHNKAFPPVRISSVRTPSWKTK